ncbi:conserved hypothetical protein [Leishmania braziliensis MHOM/BR/75/M2904]|uniref:Uncharacterized protein n=2 Tax=Leishmania braziliensis TaxID=5660 RepID=A4HEQ3_LEIBR|nr:conserved hypothetical protein [Leishmania braziliensis MHOM/BR/75/M2904]CAJ2474552.1 unnamed protein product [Leishmania braziliensis]CAM39311.1 conserved hypothetical protein [Leishmania braziliensis MHOM/BR/75/M2904]SYZ66711.1 hypothetical_protein [Leishmania braziliensis MHOM/BR/75/M2904]
MQERFLGVYVRLLLVDAHPSVLLARKVSRIVALMAKRGSRKTQLGALPPAIQHVVTSYVSELQRASAAQAHARVTYVLLYLHVFLKEMQGCRVGSVFEDVCRACVAPLSGIFALLPSETSMLEQYDLSLYLFKCSLRVFGRGVFDPAFCHFLLASTWRLAAGLGQDAPESPNAGRRQRLLEYALKTHEATVVFFPSRLHELGIPFFVVDDGAVTGCASSPSSLSDSPEHTVLRLLSAVISSSVGNVVSEKAVCRALRFFTLLVSAEDGDAFIAHCLQRYVTSAYFALLLQHLVGTYLADTTTPEALSEWSRHPEEVAAQLDVDMDDEASVMSCAEQLFLALTGSTVCASASLATAWAVVNQLLQEGNVGPVTAALHAIGIGYYTMASEDASSYLHFLRGKVLPLLDPTTLALTSPFVARRMVWLVGMWCESVTRTEDRCAVLSALEGVLHHAAATQNIVLLLVALKSTENFVSDNRFTLSDLPATLVDTLLHTVQELLSRAQSPTTIKSLAGLVHVLIEKGAVQTQGDALVRLFLPPVLAIIKSYEVQSTKADVQAAAGLVVDAGGAGDEEDGEDLVSSLSMLLECLGSSLRHGESDAVIWSLLPCVIVPCTSPGGAATAWVEDNAWELLRVMAQSSRTFFIPTAAEALQMALQHTARDFAMLPLVFRVVYTLLLLRQEGPEDVVSPARLESWATTLRESLSAELCSAVAATTFAVVRTSAGPLRAVLCQHAAQALVRSSDVQSEQHTLPLAIALALSFASANGGEEQQELAAHIHAAVQSCGPSASYSQLLEQVVLLLDVSPSTLASCSLARLLDMLCRTSTVPLSEEDKAMVQRAIEGVAATSGAAASATGADDENAEDRAAPEMLLELLGDEDVPETSPHVARAMTTFAALLP